MKPILQVLAIVVDQIPGYNKPRNFWKQTATMLRFQGKSKKLVEENVQKMKEKLVQELVFDKYIRKAQNKKRGPIHNFFGRR